MGFISILNLLFIFNAVVEILTLILPTGEAIKVLIMKYIVQIIYEIESGIKQYNEETSCGVYVGGSSYSVKVDRSQRIGEFYPHSRQN